MSAASALGARSRDKDARCFVNRPLGNERSPSAIAADKGVRAPRFTSSPNRLSVFFCVRGSEVEMRDGLLLIHLLLLEPATIYEPVMVFDLTCPSTQREATISIERTAVLLERASPPAKLHPKAKLGTIQRDQYAPLWESASDLTGRL